MNHAWSASESVQPCRRFSDSINFPPLSGKKKALWRVTRDALQILCSFLASFLLISTTSNVKLYYMLVFRHPSLVISPNYLYPSFNTQGFCPFPSLLCFWEIIFSLRYYPSYIRNSSVFSVLLYFSRCIQIFLFFLRFSKKFSLMCAFVATAGSKTSSSSLPTIPLPNALDGLLGE